MSMIQSFLANDHRLCDETLAHFEAAVSNNDWPLVESSYKQFISEMNRHLNFEEKVLFPSFENRGGPQMPVLVMKSEHAHMRNFFDELKEAMDEKNSDRLLGLVETLVMLIQQHNHKEEHMLYVMCDMHLAPEASDLLGRFKDE